MILCCSLSLTISLQVLIKLTTLNNNIGDPYKEAGKVPMRTTKKDGHKEAGHDLAFKPAKTVQKHVKADFKHMTDF